MMKKLLVLALTTAAIAGAIGVAMAEGEPSISLVAPKFAEPIKVDGKLDDAGWITAAARGGKVPIDVSNEVTALAGYPRVGYVGYDNKNLNIAFVIMSDKPLVATDNPNVWEEDEAEIFLSVDGENYTQWCINTIGTIYVGDRGSGFNVDEAKIATGKSGIANYIEFSIPFSALGATPKSGDKWKMNLNGHQTDPDLWLAANATYGGFHNPERFFTLTFE